MSNKSKKILVVGNGGREHALGTALARSGAKLYFAPGNGGTADIGKNLAIAVTNVAGLFRFARDNKIDFTVVGPEAALAAGIADAFQKGGLAIFGPTQKAARLETSKGWAMDFMERHHIPHPKTFVAYTLEKATDFIRTRWKGEVIKQDGLAAGKGVYLPDSQKEALEIINRIMKQKLKGAAHEPVLFQERLMGKEVSVVAFTDGTTAVPLLPAADHKRVFDKDKGPNTGGMGAYAPVPYVSKKMLTNIHARILQPILKGMKEEGNPYHGALYAGLMLTEAGPKVIEINARFGDPETQPQMALLESDLFLILQACVSGRLRQADVKFKKSAAVCVVLAEKGYPGQVVTGHVVRGFDTITDPHINVFHAGTARSKKDILTTSGRVVGVTAYDKNLHAAAQQAYDAIGKKNGGVYFKGMHYRKDIGR